ncbi:WD40 repeat protein [Coemansia sp. RSA 988]|nr:WD40 repeat protein [Coemansia sp. RSA 988]
MYWRINCTEHLSLDLQIDTKPTEDERGKSNGNVKQHGRRPRSITYSDGARPRVDRPSPKQEHIPLAASDSTATTIVRWAYSPDRRLLAGITRQSVNLWLLRPFVLLSRLVYDEVDEFGHMVDVIWEDAESGRSNEDATRCGTLFVLLSMGFMYEIAVNRRGVILEYQFTTQHFFARGPGEGDGVQGFGLVQRRTYRLPVGGGPAICATAAGSNFAIAAAQSQVYRLTWAGALASATAVADIHDNPLAQIQQIECICDRKGRRRQELYLFSDGAVRALEFVDSVCVSSQLLDGTGPALRGTVIACSSVSNMVAVGTANGEVLVYATRKLERMERLGFGHGDMAQVTAIEWTADGSAFACGYSTGHVVVWTALGYELTATRLRGRHGTEQVRPTFMGWVAGATRLVVVGADEQHRQQGDALPFARAALNTVACEGNAKRVCLFSDDKVLVHRGALAAGARQPELQWLVAHVPPGYVASHWPLRYVAVDDEGQHVAVAGQRGVAYYSVTAGRWRLFRSTQQEAALVCTGGLLWYREYLVVACTGANADSRDSACVAFYRRGRMLEAPVALVELTSAATVMSCHGSTLLVLCANGVVNQYVIFDDVDFLQVSFRRALDVNTAIADVRCVRSLQWVPSAQFDHHASLLVHEGTALHLIEEAADDEGRCEHVCDVSTRVETMFSSGVNFGNMHSTIWWFGGTQLTAALVGLEEFMGGGTGALVGTGRQELRMRPEFFPMAVAADQGMVVGVDQDWTLEDHAVAGLARLPVRAKLYLPSILGRMLRGSGEQDALLYAACFEHLEFFAHAMEMLLHDALVGETDDVLPRTVRLLENFADFHAIVVHCARKTEAAFWPRLFACLGGPEHFFRRCLAAAHIDTATQCLIILHTLCPAATCVPNILALLVRVVDAQNSRLAEEILRFLRMTAKSDSAIATLYARISGSVSVSSDNSNGAKEVPVCSASPAAITTECAGFSCSL